MKFFDYYELRARIFPTIIVSMPVFITVLCTTYDLSPVISTLSSSAIWLVLIYALSFWVRHYGKKIEDSLWKKWNGPPSTRFIRWKDNKLNDEIKQGIHTAIKDYCDIQIMSREEEQDNSKEAV